MGPIAAAQMVAIRRFVNRLPLPSFKPLLSRSSIIWSFVSFRCVSAQSSREYRVLARAWTFRNRGGLVKDRAKIAPRKIASETISSPRLAFGTRKNLLLNDIADLEIGGSDRQIDLSQWWEAFQPFWTEEMSVSHHWPHSAEVCAILFSCVFPSPPKPICSPLSPLRNLVLMRW